MFEYVFLIVDVVLVVVIGYGFVLFVIVIFDVGGYDLVVKWSEVVSFYCIEIV